MIGPEWERKGSIWVSLPKIKNFLIMQWTLILFSTWVEPFEPRKFPLTNEEFEKMAAEMPKDDDRGILYFPINHGNIVFCKIHIDRVYSS